MAYNGGGSALEGPAATRSRPSSPTPPCGGAFGYVNHTYEHPNLDCSIARRSSRRQITAERGLGDAPAACRSRRLRGGDGRALRAGQRAARQPRHDRSAVDRRRRAGRGRGRVPVGTYDYALTARSPAGETVPVDRAQTSAVAAIGTVHGQLQRRLPRDRLRRLPPRRRGRQRGRGSAPSPAPPTRPPTTARQPITLTVTDTGRRERGRRAADGQRRDARRLRAEPEPVRAALAAAGITTVATDASKGYPSTPTVITSPLLARRRLVDAGQPCAPSRATRATSTTTSRARASSSTSTTGSTSRRPTAAAACRSRA